MTNSFKKFMILVVQIDYKLISCKHFKLAKRHTTSNICKKTTTHLHLTTTLVKWWF
jgi:hypothetical protein